MKLQRGELPWCYLQKHLPPFILTWLLTSSVHAGSGLRVLLVHSSPV
ncbi:hypothetical protein HRbin36_00621 [bacterium HR36]|nr:hypothetical protein HRbin36_00621 [bacterium HR36]